MSKHITIPSCEIFLISVNHVGVKSVSSSLRMKACSKGQINQFSYFKLIRQLNFSHNNYITRI